MTSEGSVSINDEANVLNEMIGFKNTTKETLDKTITQMERHCMHPLEINDKLAFETIKTVRLDFLTDEAEAPIPRCQALPSHAFSRLTGRSILVSLSHGWFFQTHPDPTGEKLDLIRNVFAPQLRQRYPHTDIQVFFDFLASPQRPRTKHEDKVFAVAMDRMNSMYVYADVIVFLEMKLPRIDMTLRFAKVDLQLYGFFDFVDTVQVSETKSKYGPQQFDCIQSCDSVKVENATQLNTQSGIHTLTYLHRPFGRPNTIVNDDRGWLFLERITIAIKAAAADKSRFDDIVVSNSKKLRTKIFLWTEQLRKSARKQKKKKGALRDVLNEFDKELKTKKFSFSSDEGVVRDLMTKLINQFASDWKGEVKKQVSMSKRAREILLRWGSFSEDYVERAELLCDLPKEKIVTNRVSLWMLIVAVAIMAPAISVVPVTFALQGEGVDPSTDKVGLIVSSVWLGSLLAVTSVLLLHAMNVAFAKIPIGIHTVWACLASSLITVVLSVLVRLGVSTIVPFESILVGVLSFIISDIMYGMIKFIPVKDKRTGQTKRWAIGTWLQMPASHRFDLKARAAVKRGIRTTQFASAFALAYPVLGGIFFQSSFIIQSCLIPIFFILRAAFEYGADAITSHTFGSDGMPAINFGGVLMHEICLSVMITSIKHPLVFVSLVFSDVLENTFCLWSLAKNTKSNRVSPTGEEQERRKKSLTRRSSNVVSLVKDKSNLSDQGTALFIAASLLQREAAETLVPMQAAAILTLLYKVEVKSNAIVNGWEENDWTQTMAYIGIDLGVELLVFAGTITVLHRIYPEFDAARILRGLLRMHWMEMAMLSFSTWSLNLVYQSTYSGTDMTMMFSWLKCKGESNSTWVGGLKWEC